MSSVPEANPFTIRPFEPADWPALWAVLEPVFRAGETYPYATDITEDQARATWIDAPSGTYVASDGADILGSYYIKPNQAALGAHVCNCGYVTSEAARGRGVASTMCEHSQQEGRKLGFLYMQYNLVVASNKGAFRLWKKMGFEHIGTLPKAFNNARLGLVDAHILYKAL